MKCFCREDLILLPALGLVAGGSFVAGALASAPSAHATNSTSNTTMTLTDSTLPFADLGLGSPHPPADESAGGYMLGVILQIGSSVAYAIKFTVAKILLGGGHGPPPPGTDPANMPPSKIQVSWPTQHMTGLMALIFLPAFESNWDMPGFNSIIAVAIAANGILFFELRLIELTSPLTVSVLASLHNVVIVAWFVIVEGEPFNTSQMGGFGVSTVGALLYAWAKQTQAPLHEEQHDAEDPTGDGWDDVQATDGSQTSLQPRNAH